MYDMYFTDTTILVMVIAHQHEDACFQRLYTCVLIVCMYTDRLSTQQQDVIQEGNIQGEV